MTTPSSALSMLGACSPPWCGTAGPAPELTDVRRFRHAWEKRASIELRAGSPDAIDAYQDHERIAEGDRDQMLDALHLAWKADTESGWTSLMIASDLGTVSELNARARANRVTAGAGDRGRVDGGRRWDRRGR